MAVGTGRLEDGGPDATAEHGQLQLIAGPDDWGRTADLG